MFVYAFMPSVPHGQKMYRTFFADEMAVPDRHEYKKYQEGLQIRRRFLRMDDKVAWARILFQFFYPFLDIIHIYFFGCSSFLL